MGTAAVPGSKPVVDLLEQVQDSLTVGMIMTRREHLMTCRPTDEISDVVARNERQFSYIPVLDKSDRVIGLFEARRWFKVEPPQGPVGNDFDRLNEYFLIGADASILDFIRGVDSHPTRLVVSRYDVAGLVALTDLQKLPGRAAIFSLLTSLEIVMAERISRQWPNPDDWLRLLSTERQAAIQKEIVEAKAKDIFVDEIILTQLYDKATIIRKSGLLDSSKNRMKAEFDDMVTLRDNIVHANNFIEKPDGERKFRQLIRRICEVMQELSQAEQLL